MSDQNIKSKPTFADYGKSFQEKILQALLNDPKWAENMLEVFDVDYLETKYLKFLAQKYFDYAKKYKVFPTFTLLITIIKDELKIGTDIILKEQILDYLQRMKSNPDVGDLEYVKEKSLDFCRKQALKEALSNAVDRIAESRYELIVDDIKRAVSIGTTPSIGHDFFTDYEARFTRLKRVTIPTGIKEIDTKEILNGGLGKGEFGVVIGATGAGKSHFLTMLGANALREGYNVLHYTFELSETAIGIRYDSNLCDINSNTVIDFKDDVISRYKDMKLGRLIIKEYPTHTCTVHKMRNHMEKLELKGFTPDLVIIDYADIMKSSRQFDSLRHELKLVYEELRGLAMERGLAIWTASQSNKEGSNAEIIDLGNMSEAYGKAMVADFIASISRRSHEKATGYGRLFIAKNRAGKDGIVFPVQIDTARSKFAIVGVSDTLATVDVNDEKEMKKALKAKLKELEEEMGKKNK